MMYLTKSFFSTLLITLIVVPVSAQQQRGQQNIEHKQVGELRNIPHEIRSETRIEVFNEYLSLSDDQINQLRTVYSELTPKRIDLREESMRAKRKKLTTENLKKKYQMAVHDILTKDQYSIFLEQQDAIQYDIHQRLNTYTEEENK